MGGLADGVEAPRAGHVDRFPQLARRSGHAGISVTRELPDAAEALRVLTYNVWRLPVWAGGRSPRRMAAISDRLRRMRLDIVGLQEMWSSSTAVIVEAAGFEHRSHPRGTRGLFGASGLVTLSRHPIVEHAACTFSRKAGLERFVGKGALFTRVRLPDGGLLDVFNTHLLSRGTGLLHGFPPRAAALVNDVALRRSPAGLDTG